jgi:hypothetical protein
MAKKTTKSSKNVVAKTVAPTTTAVRNSAVPPKTVAAAKKAAITSDQIAIRAFGIWQSGQGGNQDDNWFRAERELRGV